MTWGVIAPCPVGDSGLHRDVPQAWVTASRQYVPGATPECRGRPPRGLVGRPLLHTHPSSDHGRYGVKNSFAKLQFYLCDLRF